MPPPQIRSAPMRVLVVTNFVPDPSAPQRGRWVADQVGGGAQAGGRGRGLQLPDGTAASTRRQPGACGACCGGRASTSSTPTTASPAPAPSSPGRGHCWSPSTAPTSAIRSSGAISRRLAHRIDLVAGVSRALFAPEGGRPGLPQVAGGKRRPPLRPRPGPLRADPPPRGAARARPRSRGALSALPGQPDPAGEAPRSRRRAGGCRRRHPARRRRHRTRAGCRSG